MKSQRRLMVSALVMLVTFVCFSQQAGAQRTGGRGSGGTGINISKIRLGTEYVDGEVKGGYGNQVFRPKDHVILCVASISKSLGRRKVQVRLAVLRRGGTRREADLRAGTYEPN